MTALHGSTIVIHESEVRIGLSRGWLETYRVHVDWEYNLTEDADVPVVNHITPADCPSDKAHDLLSAPAGSLPRLLGERLKTEWEGCPTFGAAALEAWQDGHDGTTTAQREGFEIRREKA